MSNPAPTPVTPTRWPWLDKFEIVVYIVLILTSGASLKYSIDSANTLVAKFDALTGKVDQLASRLNPPAPTPVPPVVPPQPAPAPVVPPAPQPTPAPQPQPVPVTSSITIPAGQTGPVLLRVHVGNWLGFSSVNGVQPGTYPVSVEVNQPASVEAPEGN